MGALSYSAQDSETSHLPQTALPCLLRGVYSCGEQRAMWPRQGWDRRWDVLTQITKTPKLSFSAKKSVCYTVYPWSMSRTQCEHFKRLPVWDRYPYGQGAADLAAFLEPVQAEVDNLFMLQNQHGRILLLRCSGLNQQAYRWPAPIEINSKTSIGYHGAGLRWVSVKLYFYYVSLYHWLQYWATAGIVKRGIGSSWHWIVLHLW